MDAGLIHTQWLFVGGFVAWMIGAASLLLARRSPVWGDRRSLHLLSLTAPLLVVGVLGMTIIVMLLRGCNLFSFWDTVASFLTVASASAFLFVSFGRHAWRSRRAKRMLFQIAEPCRDKRVRRVLDRLVKQLGVSAPALVLCETEYPVACIMGVRRPTVLLSTWMLENLDDGELEAVLAHELVHLRHHDNLIGWVASWLKEGLFYLPTANAAWRQLHADRELVSDAVTIQVTNKPMALASALAKVWQQGLTTSHRHPELVAANFGGEANASVEARIHRLLGHGEEIPGTIGFSVLSWAVLAVGILLMVGALAPFYMMPTADGGTCLLMRM